MALYWVWMSELKKLSSKGFHRVLSCFGSPEAAYHATDLEIAKGKGLTGADKEALKDRSLQRAEEILRICSAKEIGILKLTDPDYPELLRHIPDPPAVLYYIGALPDFGSELTIGVVGQRKATKTGMANARRLGYELSKSGAVVISGCAKGIDAAAMEGALRGGSPVVGVLGCGVDVIYPEENWWLYEAVCRQGCLISEYAPGEKPDRWNFPARNRIISGLSRGVVIVEAPRKSGALITARLASEQGRDVFAVPGAAGAPESAGSNDLLRQGAAFAETGIDIIGGYSYLFPDRIHELSEAESLAFPEEEAWLSDPDSARISHGTGNEASKEAYSAVDKPDTPAYIDVSEVVRDMPQEDASVLMALQDGPQQIDVVIRTTGLTAARVLGALTLLQIKGLVKPLPGGSYSLCER